MGLWAQEDMPYENAVSERPIQGRHAAHFCGEPSTRAREAASGFNLHIPAEDAGHCTQVPLGDFKGEGGKQKPAHRGFWWMELKVTSLGTLETHATVI